MYQRPLVRNQFEGSTAEYLKYLHSCDVFNISALCQHVGIGSAGRLLSSDGPLLGVGGPGDVSSVLSGHGIGRADCSGIASEGVVDAGPSVADGQSAELGTRCDFGCGEDQARVSSDRNDGGLSVGVSSSYGAEANGANDGVFVKSKRHGKWYEHNKRRKAARKIAKLAGGTAAKVGGTPRVHEVSADGFVPVWRRKTASAQGSCETVVSNCPSYGAALSDAEREAKDSLARRRVVENEVAMELARLKLASLRDEKKCADYAALKQQRIVQWTNESLAKSQASLDKCKSIDPGSSASQYEFKKQAKENIDLKNANEFLRDKIRKHVPEDAEDIILSAKLAGMRAVKDIRIDGDDVSESDVYEEPDLGEFMSRDCFVRNGVC